MTCTGASLLFEALKHYRVNKVFGYPGGAALHLYDELTRRPKSEIKHYITAHEQGAVHSAEGYAKSSDKVGVVFTTSGPGATNITTGLANAYADSTPLVAITCNVGSSLIGTNAFQEVNVCEITKTITKKNFFVNDVENMQATLCEAFLTATTGRKGPVLVDICKDVFVSQCEKKDWNEVEEKFKDKKVINDNQENNKKFDKILNLVFQSRQPIFYCGGGIKSDNKDILYKLVKLTGFPIATTMMAKGIYPEEEQENLHMLGMHGSYEANLALYNCDLMLVIGARFDDRITCAISKFSPNSQKVHVDIDANELNKLVKVDIAMQMDSYEFLQKFYSLLKQKIENDNQKLQDLSNWWKQITEWRSVKCFNYCQNTNKTIKPQFALDVLNKCLKEEKSNSKNYKSTLFSTDVGQHQIWATQYLQVEDKKHFITSGGLGTMGFGLPSAIGAQIANPNKRVVLITGDGSFMMTEHEMSTIKKYKLPVKIVLLNNSWLGMVKQWQNMFYNKRYSETYLKDSNPDFIKLAKSFSIKAKRVKKVSNVKKEMRKMLNSKSAYLLEVITDEDEKVYPMTPAGCGHNEILLHDDC